MNPIYTGTPVFKKEVANGQLYIAGTGNDTIPIVHVWGELCFFLLIIESHHHHHHNNNNNNNNRHALPDGLCAG